MKFTYIKIIVCLLFGLQQTAAQITGAPSFFSEPNTEFKLGFHYDLSMIKQESYLYTLLPILNNNIYQGDVTWVSGNESAVTINEKGEATIIGFAFELFELKGTITDENGRTHSSSVLLDLSPNGGFDNLTVGQIVVNKEIYEGSEQRIRFVLFPNGNTDESTFKIPSLYTISDETIASISSTGKLIGHKPGTVTITGTSSVNNSIRASIKVTVLFTADEEVPIISINAETDIENDIFTMQRGSSNVIPTASAEDNKDGTIPVSITETGTPFSGTTIGDYPIRYSAKDAANNEAIINLTLQVVDTIAPVISLTDTSLEFAGYITANQGENLSIPKVTAVDDNGDVINVMVNTDNFDPDVIGEYTITYTATDPSGNFDERFINLEITVGNPPSLEITGYEDGAVININQDQEFTIPEATAIDAMGNVVAITTEGIDSFDTATPGTYTIKYSATDRFELSTEKQIQIRVKDIISPEITNAEDLLYLQRILTSTPSTVVKVNATDNVGVTRYTIQERNSFTSTRTHDVNWYTEYYKGTIAISNDGTITATKPTEEDFNHKHQHYFIIKAIDADGNESGAAYLTLSHVDEEPPVIKIKERITDRYFTQIGYNGIGELYKEFTKQENLTKVGDTIFQINSNIPNYAFDSYELAGADASNFRLSSANNTTSITLTTPLDADVKSEYNFILNTYAKLNPIDPATVFPTKFTVHIKTPAELAPELPAIQTILNDSPEVIPDPVTGEKILSLQNLITANGLQKTAGLFGEALQDVFSANYLEYPIISDYNENKAIFSKLPFGLFIVKENKITRIFIKGQKGPVAFQIEFVIDKNVNGAYWMMNIGSSIKGAGIQPSRDIHSSLAFLDHVEGNIVYSNTTVNKSNFKCLTLVTNDNLKAGIHLVAKGPLVPGGVAFANPNVETRIGVTEAGWTVPDLTVKMKLDAKFLSGFDSHLSNYILDATDVAKKGILAAAKQITDLKNNIKDAEVVFDAAKYPIKVAQRKLDMVTVPGYSSAKRTLEDYTSIRNNYAKSRDKWLRAQICGDICVPFYFPPRICYKWGFAPYPCSAGHLGEVCANGICIPDPRGIARSASYAALVISLDVTISAAQLALDGLKGSLELAKEPFKLALKGAEEALEQAKISLEAAKLALIAAEEAASVAEAGYGEVGKIARYLLSRLPRLMKISDPSFETTLAVANSGTIKGKLGFGFIFKGGPKVDKEIDFNFSDPVGSTLNFGKSFLGL